MHNATNEINVTHTNPLFKHARALCEGYLEVTVEDRALFWGMSGDHKWALIIYTPKMRAVHPVLRALRSYSYTHRDERGRRLKVRSEGSAWGNGKRDRIVINLTY